MFLPPPRWTHFSKYYRISPPSTDFFWQGVKRQNSRQPTHDYQQPICLSNKCHHLLQLQSSSRGRTKRIELLSTTIITSYLSSLFFESRASLYLSLNMMMKISICQKKRKEKIENNNNSEQNKIFFIVVLIWNYAIESQNINERKFVKRKVNKLSRFFS